MGYEGVLASFVTLVQTLHSARRPEYFLGSGSVRWEQWASISEGRTTSGGSVAAAALAGQPGRVALFLTDPAGGVYTTAGSVK
jgi:hypothetical protein